MLYYYYDVFGRLIIYSSNTLARTPLQFTIATSANNFRGTRNFEEYDRDVTGEKNVDLSKEDNISFIVYSRFAF